MVDMTSLLFGFISQRSGRGSKFARGFAPAVNEKEKSRQADEGQSASEHPHFIRKKRSDLLGGEKRQGDSQHGGQEAAQTSGDESAFAVAAPREEGIGGDAQQCAEHVEKRNQLKYNGKGQEFLKRLLNASAGEAEVDDHQNQRDRCMHNESRVRCGVFRMDLAEPVGHVGIETCYERDSCRATKPGGGDSGDG